MRGVRYRYPQTSNWVLQGIYLSIPDGEFLLIGGSSGSGKSTLGYLCTGLIPHFFGGVLEGSVEVQGIRTRDVKVSELLTHVGMVLQNADAQLFNSTVEDEIAFGLESLGLSGKEIEQRIDEAVRTLPIEGLLHRSPMALSGGEKRLVAMASVLCLEPSILVLDEPFAHLDWEGTARLKEVLSRIHRMGRTLIVIEQRLEGLLDRATRCLILEGGNPVFDGPPWKADGVLIEKGLLPTYPERRKTGRPEKEVLFSVKDLTCRLNHLKVLEGVSFVLRGGESVAIIGKNGSGKTTLIKHLNGLLQAPKGTVFFKGKDLHGTSPSEMAPFLGISFQDPNDQFFKSRAREELLVGPRITGREDREWIEEIVSLFDLKGLLDRSPYRLSEGEKKRLSIASILAHRPEAVVLDEPTVGQDGRFREALAGLLRSLQDRGFTTLLVTHDLEFARAVAGRWIVLHEGRIVGDGSPEALWEDGAILRTGALGHPSPPSCLSFSCMAPRPSSRPRDTLDRVEGSGK